MIPPGITVYKYNPPIPGGPIWYACIDNDPSDLQGEGKTKKEAIEDLEYKWEEREYK